VTLGVQSPPLAEHHDDAAMRILDITFALVIAALLAPALLVIAALIRLDSAGPVLFRQKRYGRGGEIFEILKFRTMTAAACIGAVVQARRSDLRVTRVGAFLRRTSLDELPQLINVLRGDMSLVGPRPHPLGMDHEFAATTPRYAIRFVVRPGMTGLSQICGFRGEIRTRRDLRARIARDLAFVRRRSLALYLRILLVTPFVVFTQEQAY
jgi:lipopolysaccharide/colanic/teichoic acid biosynthesis glycosyltransferase